MILPTDERCREIITALVDEPSLTEWEYDFVSSNLNRTEFTDRQREVMVRLIEKYEV